MSEWSMWVISWEHNGEQLRRLREMFAQSPIFSTLLQGPEHRFVLTNQAYQQSIGHRDVIGLTVREAIPEVESQGFLALLDKVSKASPTPGRSSSRKTCTGK
jgi:hypothetical protein